VHWHAEQVSSKQADGQYWWRRGISAATLYQRNAFTLFLVEPRLSPDRDSLWKVEQIHQPITVTVCMTPYLNPMTELERKFNYAHKY
jgi:hypothetical protein